MQSSGAMLQGTVFNWYMDMKEAIECAKTVNAKHSIPYHMAPGKPFDEKKAETFDVPNRLIVPAGTEIILTREAGTE